MSAHFVPLLCPQKPAHLPSRRRHGAKQDRLRRLGRLRELRARSLSAEPKVKIARVTNLFCAWYIEQKIRCDNSLRGFVIERNVLVHVTREVAVIRGVSMRHDTALGHNVPCLNLLTAIRMVDEH